VPGDFFGPLESMRPVPPGFVGWFLLLTIAI
jgi:hypothetical protein